MGIIVGIIIVVMTLVREERLAESAMVQNCSKDETMDEHWTR